MPCCVDFGIVDAFNPDQDYALLDTGHPDPYRYFLKEYRCVSVDDDIVNEWIVPSIKMPSYLGTLSRPSHGIDHYAVTLVPPASLPVLLEIVKPWEEADESVRRLTGLIQEAIENGKYMIVYGV